MCRSINLAELRI